MNRMTNTPDQRGSAYEPLPLETYRDDADLGFIAVALTAVVLLVVWAGLRLVGVL